MESLLPNDFGGKVIAENCQKVSITDLLRLVEEKMKEALLSAEIEAAGLTINLTTSLTRFGGKRHWFQCPLCHGRVGVLYRKPVSPELLGCRECLGVDYRKRRYKGMVEGEI